jgi:hypothetical protein
LENSIAHLQKTQDELKTYLSEEPEGDDGGELSEAMRENEGVMWVSTCLLTSRSYHRGTMVAGSLTKAAQARQSGLR